MNITGHIKLDIKGHNRFITDERMDKMSNIQLLRNSHPLYREWFAKNMYPSGEITEDELNMFITKS